MTFLDNGLALQMADYSRVVLVNAVDNSNNKTGSVVITDAEKKGGPVVYRQVDTSVPITR
jgi:Ni,Fe-hydrogenase maturation factor